MARGIFKSITAMALIVASTNLASGLLGALLGYRSGYTDAGTVAIDDTVTQIRIERMKAELEELKQQRLLATP